MTMQRECYLIPIPDEIAIHSLLILVTHTLDNGPTANDLAQWNMAAIVLPLFIIEEYKT